MGRPKMIRFNFEGKKYEVDPVAAETLRFKLPDKRVLMVEAVRKGHPPTFMGLAASQDHNHHDSQIPTAILT